MTRATALGSCVVLLTCAVAEAQTPDQLVFRDDRPLSVGWDDLPKRVTICNLSDQATTVAVSIEGDDAALIKLSRPGSEEPARELALLAGRCGSIDLVRATKNTAPSKAVDALLFAETGTAIARLPVRVAPPAAGASPAVPSPPAKKITLDAEGWPRRQAALDSGSSIPIALGNDATAVSSPEEGTTIGVLTNGTDQSTLIAGKTSSEDGVVTLAVSADGLDHVGTYAGTAQLVGGEKPVTVEVDVDVSNYEGLKYAAIAAGLILGAVVVLVFNKSRPRRQLRRKAEQMKDDFAPAVEKLNVALGRPPRTPDRFEVDVAAVDEAHAEALAAIDRDEKSSFLVDTSSATYKAAAELVDRAAQDRNLLEKELAEKLRVLEEALNTLSGNFPSPAPAVAANKLTAPAFLNDLRKVSLGCKLTVGSATKIAAKADSATALISAWTTRADYWNRLAALVPASGGDATGDAARTSLEAARRLLLGAGSSAALDAAPLDKELGTTWALVSALRPFPDPPVDTLVEETAVTGALTVAGSAFTLPGFSRISAHLSRPLSAFATGGATLILALSALAAYYVGIEEVLKDDTFGTFTDYVAALGLASIASGGTFKSATNLANLVPREPSAAAGEPKADKAQV
jgi:hypothetical protein